MPGRDRSGPNAQGPMTGRGAGDCNPNTSSTSAGFGRSGRGFGWRNLGRGMRNRFRAPFGQGRGWFDSAPPLTQDQEKEMLQSQARDMQSTLDQIKDRLNNIDE